MDGRVFAARYRIGDDASVPPDAATRETQAMPATERRRWWVLSAVCGFGLGVAEAAPVPDLPVVVAPPPTAVVIARTANPPQPPTIPAIPIALPMPPTTSMALALVAPAEPTAAEVAQLYGVVGRKLSALEKSHGQVATLELWPRYRILRIQAMLADPIDRRNAVSRLREIAAQIDAAAKP